MNYLAFFEKMHIICVEHLLTIASRKSSASHTILPMIIDWSTYALGRSEPNAHSTYVTYLINTDNGLADKQIAPSICACILYNTKDTHEQHPK